VLNRYSLEPVVLSRYSLEHLVAEGLGRKVKWISVEKAFGHEPHGIQLIVLLLNACHSLLYS